MTDSQTPRPEPIELWLLPAPFDLAEDNWRAITITFLPGAAIKQTFEKLFELALEFDAQRFDGDFWPPHDDIQLTGCSVRFEMDSTAETIAMLLFRAAYLVRGSGIPTESDVIVLSDPDRVWNFETWKIEANEPLNQ